MSISKFHDELQSLSAANSVEDVTKLLCYHSEKLGFDNFIYALRIPTSLSESRIVMIKGYSEQWLNHYFENSYYDNDPVILYCSRHIVPVKWHDLGLAKASVGERIMKEATEFGIKAGISMPVHSPSGELGILSLALNQNLIAANEITQQALPYVQLLASYLHEAVRRVFGLINQHEKLILTLREQECLR